MFAACAYIQTTIPLLSPIVPPPFKTSYYFHGLVVARTGGLDEYSREWVITPASVFHLPLCLRTPAASFLISF